MKEKMNSKYNKESPSTFIIIILAYLMKMIDENLYYNNSNSIFLCCFI